MMREWKPGDVALLRLPGFGDRRAIMVGRDWVDSRHAIWRTNEVLDARPLVVIDPEDREQVERLLRGYAGWANGSSDGIENYPRYVDEMQAALRSLIEPPKPPKPPEPQGLGAVVEDADDSRWIRIWGPGIKAAWVGSRGGQDPDETVRYDDIAVVRVLSEGVS